MSFVILKWTESIEKRETEIYCLESEKALLISTKFMQWLMWEYFCENRNDLHMRWHKNTLCGYRIWRLKDCEDMSSWELSEILGRGLDFRDSQIIIQLSHVTITQIEFYNLNAFIILICHLMCTFYLCSKMIFFNLKSTSQ